MEERYINPQTDFGFKRLFGSEFNKELLISFLNAIFTGKQNIKDVTYLNSEQLGEFAERRRAVFNVYCENDKGERFIVEMQNMYQEFFKDRTIYYSTFPIREQAQKGKWNFQLNGVYTVGLLNFIFENKDESESRLQHEVKLMDVDTKEVFYDKLTYLYIEIPKFNKPETELVTMYDKWMFVLKNLSNLLQRPAALQERVFTRLFEQAEIAKFNDQELKAYEDSMNAYRDVLNALDARGKMKFAEGKAEGIAEGRVEGIAEGKAEGKVEERAGIVHYMLGQGRSFDEISQLTGLSKEDIEQLGIKEP